MASHSAPSFAVLLRQYRLSKGISQGVLAERAGLSLQAVSALERGLRHTPRPETVRLLGEGLELTEEEIATLNEVVPRGRLGSSPLAAPSSPAAGPRDALTPLIGRDGDAAALLRLLSFDPHASTAPRLLTLTGPGGVGKTRLAMQVAAAAASRFADGMVWVDLAPLRDACLVTATIARRLGVQENGAVPLQERLIRDLKDKELLLVLDNVEHLMPARLTIVDLLDGCPLLTVLTTSRAALHVRGEHEYATEPLALPRRDASPAVIGQAAAVRLFMERAQAMRPDLELTGASAPVVAEICRRLDGLPLALELAAGLVKILAPADLLARLARPRGAPGGALDVLTGGAWDLPDRQQTLRATLEWSYNLLTPGEQVLLCRLAVFAGGATPAAVEAVCRTPDQLPGAVLAVLRTLVDKSLLRLEAADLHAETRGESRLVMLETVRDFAMEHLAATDEGEDMRARHAAYYLALAEQAEAALNGPRQAHWYERLEHEYDNLRAALDWMLEDPAADPATACHRRTLGLRLAGTLWQFWHDHGHVSEGRAWLARCLVGEHDEGSALARAKALNGAGWMAVVQDDYAEAVTLLEESVALYRQLAVPAELSFALCNLAGASYRCSDYGRATVFYEEALAVARACGERPNEVNALSSLALIAREQGDFERATHLYEQCLAVSRALGHLEYIPLGSLGHLAREQGDGPRAQALLEETLALARRAGDLTHASGLLLSLARVVQDRGDDERAAALLREAARLYREMGHMQGLGAALLALGLTAAARGATAEGIRLCVEALQCCVQGGMTPRAAACFEGLAEVWCARGLNEHAARLCGVAEALRERIGAPLSPRDRIPCEDLGGRLRNALGDAAFTAAWQAGRATPMEQAVEDEYTAVYGMDSVGLGM